MIDTMGHHDVAAKLKALRESKGWSQEKLAGFSGVGISTIKDIERGTGRKPTLETVEQLASAFGLGLVDMLAADPSPRPPQAAAAGAPPWAARLVETVERLADRADLDGLTKAVRDLTARVDAMGEQLAELRPKSPQRRTSNKHEEPSAAADAHSQERALQRGESIDPASDAAVG